MKNTAGQCTLVRDAGKTYDGYMNQRHLKYYMTGDTKIIRLQKNKR